MARVLPIEGEREQRIADALGEMELTTLALWDDLDSLATHVEVEQVEVPVEGVIVDSDGRFSAVMNIYAVLRYGGDDEEGFRTSDSFLAKLSGRLDGVVPLVEHSSVDISSFYE